MTTSQELSGDRAEVAQVLDAAIDAIQTYGHGTDTNLDRVTGALCLNGALMVGAELRHRVNLDGEYFFMQTDRGWRDPRAKVGYIYAVRRVASVIPGDPDCLQCRTAVERQHSRDPVRAVSHFNDLHCDGAEGAILVLKTAREAL